MLQHNSTFNEVSSKNPQVLGARLHKTFMQNFRSQTYFVLRIKFKLSFNVITNTLTAFVSTA